MRSPLVRGRGSLLMPTLDIDLEHIEFFAENVRALLKQS